MAGLTPSPRMCLGCLITLLLLVHLHQVQAPPPGGNGNANAGNRNANTASRNANTASRNANTASRNTNTANRNVNTANRNVNTGSRNANTANRNMNTANQNTNTAANRNVNTANRNVNTANRNVNTANRNINNANVNGITANPQNSNSGGAAFTGSRNVGGVGVDLGSGGGDINSGTGNIGNVGPDNPGTGNSGNVGAGNSDNPGLGSIDDVPDSVLDAETIDPTITNGNRNNRPAKLIGFKSKHRKEGTYLIKIKPDDVESRALNVSKNIRNVRGGRVLADVDFAGKLRILTLRLPPGHVKRLARNPNVDFMEVDRVVNLTQSSECVESPATSIKWYLDRMDQKDLPRDNVFRAGRSRGVGTRVYVLDTGVYREHEQFEGRVVAESLQCVYDADGVSNTCTPGDYHGHGTHMAGSIGSRDYGVASRAEIVSVKVFTDQADSSTLAVFLGLQYAFIDNLITGVPGVVSMSIAARVDDDPGTSLQGSIEDSIQVLHDSGMVVVAAAGNVASLPASLLTPARSPYAVTVGCVDERDELCTFASYGGSVDVLAPGTNILSTWNGLGQYNWLDGTSSSAALVSGVVAAYLSEQPAPGAVTPDDVLFWLATSGARDKVGGDLRGTPNVIVQVPQCAPATSTR